jgi:hypothetical protein
MFEEETNNIQKNTIYVSLGNYCITSWLLKSHNLKYESYPYDWMVTCLDNVIHNLEDDFKEFLNKDNYIHNINISKGVKNVFYFKKTQELFGIKNLNTVDHQHHSLLDDKNYNYLLRCVNRFNKLNEYNLIKFIMIQPLYLTNKSIDYDKINKLYELLLNRFGENIKLFIFNISKKVNKSYKEEKINDNLILFELDTNIVKGPAGMNYFDKKGISKFINIIKNY